ncbi:hypothetical protein [Nocardiopsis composta]|uniref:Uncharacterized protein n=1 Tax=Nocardiopsis composta TaxID=157465 RepID=A0A7W8VGH9_9ACTN|nr:hypothetical protein [Nocardiopsis composta]MBB5435190.1 hypothetical protein [Nocardiopsis composta]
MTPMTLPTTTQDTGPLGLVRPVPRGSTAPRRAFGGQRPRTAPGRAAAGAEWARMAPAGPPGGAGTVGAAQALFAALGAVGVGGVYGAVHGLVSVVSLPRGVTVWVRGGVLSWRDSCGRARTHPAADAQGAARLLVAELRPATGAHAA